MIQITKIFRFEMAHAIFGYAGRCKNIHGHSYILQVTVTSANEIGDFIPAPGFIFDFKNLKQVVNETIIKKLDHQLVLSKEYLKAYPALLENSIAWDMEPSAENIIIFIKKNLQMALPSEIRLVKIKLFETADSFAEWVS